MTKPKKTPSMEKDLLSSSEPEVDESLEPEVYEDPNATDNPLNKITLGITGALNSLSDQDSSDRTTPVKGTLNLSQLLNGFTEIIFEELSRPGSATNLPITTRPTPQQIRRFWYLRFRQLLKLVSKNTTPETRQLLDSVAEQLNYQPDLGTPDQFIVAPNETYFHNLEKNSPDKPYPYTAVLIDIATENLLDLPEKIKEETLARLGISPFLSPKELNKIIQEIIHEGLDAVQKHTTGKDIHALFDDPRYQAATKVLLAAGLIIPVLVCDWLVNRGHSFAAIPELGIKGLGELQKTMLEYQRTHFNYEGPLFDFSGGPGDARAMLSNAMLPHAQDFTQIGLGHSLCYDLSGTLEHFMVDRENSNHREKMTILSIGLKRSMRHVLTDQIKATFANEDTDSDGNKFDPIRSPLQITDLNIIYILLLSPETILEGLNYDPLKQTITIGGEFDTGPAIQLNDEEINFLREYAESPLRVLKKLFRKDFAYELTRYMNNTSQHLQTSQPYQDHDVDLNGFTCVYYENFIPGLFSQEQEFFSDDTFHIITRIRSGSHLDDKALESNLEELLPLLAVGGILHVDDNAESYTRISRISLIKNIVTKLNEDSNKYHYVGKVIYKTSPEYKICSVLIQKMENDSDVPLFPIEDQLLNDHITIDLETYEPTTYEYIENMIRQLIRAGICRNDYKEIHKNFSEYQEKIPAIIQNLLMKCIIHANKTQDPQEIQSIIKALKDPHSNIASVINDTTAFIQKMDDIFHKFFLWLEQKDR